MTMVGSRAGGYWDLPRAVIGHTASTRSFLIAYAIRIGQRLRETAEREMASRSDLLPVLRNRDVQVQEALIKVFPNTVRARGSRVDSLEGWDSGRAAADEAQLG